MMRFFGVLLWAALLFHLVPGYAQQSTATIAELDARGEYYFNREQLDSSAYYHRQALELARKQADLSSELNAYNWLFVIHYYTGATDSMAVLVERMTPLAEQIQARTPKDFEILSSFWGYKSFYHYAQGELAQNITAVRKALELYEQQPEIDTSELAIKYQNLGIALEEIGAYDQAHDYSRKALELLRPSPSRLHIQLDSLTIITSLAVQMTRLKQYESAEVYFQQGGAIADAFRQTGDEAARTASALFYQQWGSNHYFREAYEPAANAFEKAQELLDRSEAVSDLEPQLLRYRARNALARERLDEAWSLIMTARQLIREHFPRRLDQMAATQELLGEIEQTRGDFSEALSAYQNALQNLCPEFRAEKFSENPELTAMTYSKNDLLRILRKKGESLRSNGQPGDAINTFQLAIQLYHHIREDFLTEESRLFLSGQTVPLFAAAAETAIELRQTDVAFQLIEQSKALLLQEGLKDEEAYAMTGVPTQLSDRMQQLQLQQTYWERSRYEAQVQGDSNSIQAARDKLFQINNERYQLQERIRREYPDFFALKFGRDSLDLHSLSKQLLTSDAALIEFFTTEEKVFVFGISPKMSLVKIIPKSEDFIETMGRVLDALHLNSNSAPSQYAQDAYAVYEQYLAPVLEAFQHPISKLYIIPDGLFNYLPFEALLTEAPQESAYSTFPYLIRKHSCTYAYSASLLLDSQASETKSGRAFIGFAPNFDAETEAVAQRADLGPLRYNISAVESIQGLTGGTIYTHQAAAKHNLLALTSAPLVLHLSTHARMDDQDPMGSKIYLADGDISTREIYHFPHSCQMVVLSACETGTGKYYKGEGMMSLARAFLQSGSRSVVTSLWKVDDRSTGELMVLFYQNLMDGINKDDALRAAKLDFLASKQSEMLHHPYYWAPFIHIGDPQSLVFPQSFPYWMLGVVFLLGLGGYLFWRSRPARL